MIAVYPGTFDPITNGHLDIITRVSKLCDKLIVAVLDNVAKKTLFSLDERLTHIQTAARHLRHVDVVAFEGLQVDIVRQYRADVLIRGIRTAQDAQLELTMAMNNRCMAPGVETLFIAASPAHVFISSSGVKEIAAFGGNLSGMTPQFIVDALKEKMEKEI